MRKKLFVDKKIFLFYTLFALSITVLLPLSVTALFPGITEETPKIQKSGIEIPETVTLYRVSEDRFDEINLEEYVTGVVAAEMPSSFELEALKAQAVASRTYAVGRILSGATLCDTVHCQAYRSKTIPSKVRRAVKATKGQLLTYKGKLAAHALYFSSSGGPTENSEDVFSGEYPYLRSVASSNEPGATHRNEKKVLTISEFGDTIASAFPELSFGSIKRSNIRILSHTEGGRVYKIQVGDQTLTGADIRSALELCSTRFSISFGGRKIVFKSSGFGHGVGMSQYGANGLAKDGKSYKKILSHYYKGTKVKAGHN